MTEQPLERLLEKLCAGDSDSAEQVFRTYEPYLRMVVRRMLPDGMRAKFDSVDVVQSVWVDLVQGFREANWQFTNAGQLRAFLVKVTRNRFLDRQRHFQTSLAREHSLEGAGLEATSTGPRPVDDVKARELWEELLARSCPQHQELLRLKVEGFSLDEIAERTGYHPSSIRRILYELAEQFAEEEPNGEAHNKTP